MYPRLLASAVMAIALAQGAAFAQSNNSLNRSNNEAASTQQLPQTIKNKLEQDGFSDVKVVPGSFLVSAKDKNGDNVNMIIGPHSMMVLTESSSSESSTTGSGAGTDSGNASSNK
jgi:hypothetical protein